MGGGMGGGGRGNTIMIQMLPKLHIPVPPRRNMKVPLHLIQLQAAINPAAIRLLSPQPRRLPPPRLALPQRHNIMNMLLPETLIMLPANIPLARNHPPVLIPPQLMYPLAIHPLPPVRRLPLQLLGGQDAVARGVLDVDVQVDAAHAQDDVEVEVEDARDALFDGERVLLGAAPPVAQLGPEEEQGDEPHGDGPFAAARGPGYILRFGFGCGEGQES